MESAALSSARNTWLNESHPIEKKEVISRRASFNSRETSSNTTLLFGDIGRPDWGSYRYENVTCLAYSFGVGAPNAWYWIKLTEVCFALVEWQAFAVFVIATAGRRLPHNH